MNIRDASYYNKISNEIYKNKIIQLKNEIIKNIEDRAKQGYKSVTKDCEAWPSDMLSAFMDELIQKGFIVWTCTDPYGILQLHIKW